MAHQVCQARGDPDVALGSDRVEAPSAPQWVGWLLAAGQCLLAVSLAWQWLCVSTYRLYLDERRAPESSAPARARQRFEIRGGRVEPQILTTEDERLSFPVDFPRPSELRLRAVPGSQATFEIAIVQQGARRVLYRRRLSEAADIAQPLPPTIGLLELASQGELVWSDPRVVQGADVAPVLLGLLALLALTGLRAGWPAPLALPRAAWARTALLGGLTAGIAAGLCLVVLEVGLRAVGDRLPSWITAPRRNLGEVHADPRWQDSVSYGARLAPASTPSASGSTATSSAWGSSRPASFAIRPTASLSSPMPTASATPNRSRRPPWWRPWGIPSPTA